MAKFTFISPTGMSIAGLLQDGGRDAWPVVWPSQSGPDVIDDYRGDGPDAPEWETLQMCGYNVWLDDAGDMWLSHHLLAEGQALPDWPVVGAMRNEMLWIERAQALRSAVDLFNRDPSLVEANRLSAIAGEYYEGAANIARAMGDLYPRPHPYGPYPPQKGAE